MSRAFTGEFSVCRPDREPDKSPLTAAPSVSEFCSAFMLRRGQTAYAFFDDTGTHFPDLDGGDMVVKITFANAVPLRGHCRCSPRASPHLVCSAGAGDGRMPQLLRPSNQKT
jgi:hypothetical protein